jgi:hypothetical protein
VGATRGSHTWQWEPHVARALAREGVGPADPHSHHGRSKTTQAVARDPAVTAEQEGNAARAAEQAALQAKERREELKVRKDAFYRRFLSSLSIVQPCSDSDDSDLYDSDASDL